MLCYVTKRERKEKHLRMGIQLSQEGACLAFRKAWVRGSKVLKTNESKPGKYETNTNKQTATKPSFNVLATS